MVLVKLKRFANNLNHRFSENVVQGSYVEGLLQLFCASDQLQKALTITRVYRPMHESHPIAAVTASPSGATHAVSPDRKAQNP
ncbi:hypothetical protein C8N42_10375 [Celeribacter persicus]|uniref:Uncharacterized protein n=1 Tax=Celeribacter persicus TaxID=1651082 RepID=A0A2T5HT65_9RHOB|nr:hypothetical protein C8N42_10375 [Celeribacter persicus]